MRNAGNKVYNTLYQGPLQSKQLTPIIPKYLLSFMSN